MCCSGTPLDATGGVTAVGGVIGASRAPDLSCEKISGSESNVESHPGPDACPLVLIHMLTLWSTHHLMLILMLVKLKVVFRGASECYYR